MTVEPTDCVIIGGGLSGLTAAYCLHRAGIRFTLVEKSPRLGGVIQSQVHGDFRVEGGPHTFTAGSQALLALCNALGLTPVATHPQAKKRYLALRRGLTPLPMDPLSFLTSPVLSPRGKARLLAEPWQPRTQGAEVSVADFVRRRLGVEVLDNLVGPFLSGVYAGDPETLSLPAVFPRLWQWEQVGGSLLRGAFQQVRQAKAAASSPGAGPKKHGLLSFPNGMETLIHALTAALPRDSLRTATPAEGLQPRQSSGEGFRVLLANGTVLESPALILATPAFETHRLLQPLCPQDALAPLAAIPYPPLWVVHLGFAHIPHPLDGFGFLVPRQAGLPLLGAIWTSSLFAGRTPPGQVLLSCFLGGALHPEVADWEADEAVAQAVTGLQAVFGGPPLEPTWRETFFYRRAIPQYTLGHGQRMAALDEALRHQPELFVTGNYRHGVSLNDTVKSAEATAQEALHFLADKIPSPL